MSRGMSRTRRRFLQTISTSVPAAILGVGAGKTYGNEVSSNAESRPDASLYVDLGSTAAGDGTILFRKHILDLGPAESVTVADMNGDSRLDIICGENWYEQRATERGHGPRFIKHKFRDLPYTDNYLEDLSDLAIDVAGDGHPDIVSCSYWSKPLTWWENPGNGEGRGKSMSLRLDLPWNLRFSSISSIPANPSNSSLNLAIPISCSLSMS